MNSNDGPQSKENSACNLLFISTILLVTVAVATEGLTTPVG